MMQHTLRTWPEFFAGIIDGEKDFEIRKNDRDYQPLDVLVCREFDPTFEIYSGRVLYGRIIRVWKDCPGIEPGFVALSMNWDLYRFHAEYPTT